MKALEDVVLFKIDAEKGEGVELAKEFEIHGYPTFVFATADAQTMDRWSGYSKPSFLGDLGGALADPTTIEQKKARFASKPTADDAAKLARYHETRDAHEDAIGLYRRAMELDESREYSFEVFSSYVYGYGDDGFTVDQVKKAADAVFASDRVEPQNFVNAVDMLKYVGRKAEMSDLAIPYIEPALAKTANSQVEGMEEKRTGLQIDHALLIEKDKDKAYLLKVATMSDDWKEDPKSLNGFAWWCFENSVQLKEAEVLARRGAELSPAGTERAMILDTVAEICNARGNCDDAVELMEQAVANAPESEYYKEQLERFQKIRAESAN